MTTRAKVLLVVALLVIVAAIAGAAVLLRHGFSAREEPSAIEAYIARRLRRLGIPADARSAVNPVPRRPEALVKARGHWADHCASCHANDGTGNTRLGRHMYPKAPDMRLAATQSLSDAELFYIIENGIRFTGMPAWGDDTPEGKQASWELVHFIRRLQELTPEEIKEMEGLNPRSPEEIRQEIEIEKFLEGEETVPSGGSEKGSRPHGH